MVEPNSTTGLGELQLSLEKSVSGKSFAMRRLFDRIIPLLEENNEIKEGVVYLRSTLEKKIFQHTLQGLLRSSFFIELVNDDISTTLMKTRWVKIASKGKKQEDFDETDPRYSTFETCYRLFVHLILELKKHLEKDSGKGEILKEFYQLKLVPYEIPIDYIGLGANRSIHYKENMSWFFSDKTYEVIKLRRHFLKLSQDYSPVFGKIMRSKVEVKTYLTDRVQTGTHKTNREKRWEVHPESVHFALRRTCWDIETTLMKQLLNFYGFPDLNWAKKLRSELYGNTDSLYRCPVTLNVLSFEELEKEVTNPTHGKSNFQVGHLNPLKREGSSDSNGHTSKNIAWVSEDGNRIQGSLSLDETRDLLRQIAENYLKYLPNKSS